MLRSLASGCHAGEEVVDVPQIGGYISFEGQAGARTRISRTWPNAQEQAFVQEHEPKAGDSSHSSTSATQDPRKLPTRQRFVDLILSYFQIPSSAYGRIPYESGWLSGGAAQGHARRIRRLVIHRAKSENCTEADGPFNRPEAPQSSIRASYTCRTPSRGSGQASRGRKSREGCTPCSRG